MTNQALTQHSQNSNQISTQGSFKPEELSALGAAIATSIAVQRTYGKQAGDLKVVTKIFADMFNGFPMDHVLSAFKTWQMTNREFPTPVDILTILVNEGEQDPERNKYYKIGRESGWRKLSEKGEKFIDDYKQRNRIYFDTKRMLERAGIIDTNKEVHWE